MEQKEYLRLRAKPTTPPFVGEGWKRMTGEEAMEADARVRAVARKRVRQQRYQRMVKRRKAL